jgi:hypothetical protein
MHRKGMRLLGRETEKKLFGDLIDSIAHRLRASVKIMRATFLGVFSRKRAPVSVFGTAAA